MLDVDLSGTISFQELVEGVRRTAASLDDVSRWVAEWRVGVGGLGLSEGHM
jgi:hypothetical protein